MLGFGRVIGSTTVIKKKYLCAKGDDFIEI